MQDNLIDLNVQLYCKNYHNLSDICTILKDMSINMPINMPNDYISIVHSGISKGTILISENISDESYYIYLKDNCNYKYNIIYIYIWIYYKKNNMYINKNKINIKIPFVDYNIQNEIVTKYKLYDKIKEDLIKANTNLYF
jgi:hypothetical protein